MAKLTINPSQMKVNTGRQTNITQLGINPDLFTRLGNEISQSGKVFEYYLLVRYVSCIFEVSNLKTNLCEKVTSSVVSDYTI